MGHDWGEASAEAVWNELRTLSPVHAGMSYARLEAEDGL
jgi:formate dehydrogenase major subunit